jgi:hypothetical protein
VAVGTGGQNVGNACPDISAIHWANAPPVRRLGTGEILAVFSIHCCIQSTEKTDEEHDVLTFVFIYFQKIILQGLRLKRCLRIWPLLSLRCRWWGFGFIWRRTPTQRLICASGANVSTRTKPCK